MCVCMHGKYIAHISCMRGKEEEGRPGYKAICVYLYIAVTFWTSIIYRYTCLECAMV